MGLGAPSHESYQASLPRLAGHPAAPNTKYLRLGLAPLVPQSRREAGIYNRIEQIVPPKQPRTDQHRAPGGARNLTWSPGERWAGSDWAEQMSSVAQVQADLSLQPTLEVIAPEPLPKRSPS